MGATMSGRWGSRPLMPRLPAVPTRHHWCERGGGLLVFDAKICRPGVGRFHGSELPLRRHGLDPDRVYRIIDHPRMFDIAAERFDGLPLTRGHDRPFRRVGTVERPWVDDDGHLRADLEVADREAIDDVENGARAQLSV